MRQFINLVETAQAEDHGFIDRALSAIDEAGVPEQVIVDLKDGEHDKEVEINYIEVPEDIRGQGWGDKVMAVLCHLADHYGVELFLTAADEDLEDWYWKHGFEGSRHMTRKPRGQAQ